MNSDRIKEIQETTAYPESVSVQQALMKVWNECQSIPKEEVDTRGTFNEWYDKNATRFHQSQFDAKEAFFNNLNTKL